MQESHDGLTIIRAFEKQTSFSQKTYDLTNDNLKTQIFMDSMHFYFQVRIFSMSNIFFMIIGAVCIYLKGTISPIWIAMLFDQLEGVNNHLCSLMHGT
jgi:ABC-type multidrug transport system fused ATPase/permease subunit